MIIYFIRRGLRVKVSISFLFLFFCSKVASNVLTMNSEFISTIISPIEIKTDVEYENILPIYSLVSAYLYLDVI